VTFELFSTFELDSSDIGGVRGVAGLFKLLSKILGALEPKLELELEARDAVPSSGRLRGVGFGFLFLSERRGTGSRLSLLLVALSVGDMMTAWMVVCGRRLFVSVIDCSCVEMVGLKERIDG